MEVSLVVDGGQVTRAQPVGADVLRGPYPHLADLTDGAVVVAGGVDDPQLDARQRPARRAQLVAGAVVVGREGGVRPEGLGLSEDVHEPDVRAGRRGLAPPGRPAQPPRRS